MYYTVAESVCQRGNSTILSKIVTYIVDIVKTILYCAKITPNNEILIENKLRFDNFFDTIKSCNCVGVGARIRGNT